MTGLLEKESRGQEKGVEERRGEERRGEERTGMLENER